MGSSKYYLQDISLEKKGQLNNLGPRILGSMIQANEPFLLDVMEFD